MDALPSSRDPEGFDRTPRGSGMGEFYGLPEAAETRESLEAERRTKRVRELDSRGVRSATTDSKRTYSPWGHWGVLRESGAASAA